LPLAPGHTLAQYRITAALGAGGMGEVCRATDTKLGRDVALKLLPEAFAADPDRLARFEREAKLLASLNHTGIAHLYGVGRRRHGHRRDVHAHAHGVGHAPVPRAVGLQAAPEAELRRRGCGWKMIGGKLVDLLARIP
jgi:hypothetical protein